MLLLLLVLSAGCAGSSEAGQERKASTYTADLGQATRPDVARKVEDALLNRYGFRFDQRVNTSEDIRYETAWKNQIDVDEQGQDVAQSRTRIIVSARPRSRTGGGADLYTVRFVAETQVQEQGSAEWTYVPMSEAHEDYVKEIANYLRDELRSGFRSY